jgi:hypothetical protein
VSWRALELAFAHLTRLYSKTDGTAPFLFSLRYICSANSGLFVCMGAAAALFLVKYFMQSIVSSWGGVYETALAINQPFKLFERVSSSRRLHLPLPLPLLLPLPHS